MAFKGQALSEETIQKMRESKIKTMLKKYDWNIAESYLDTVIKNGETCRTRKYVTLREFKENLLKGWSSKEMKRQGISKHVLQFMSNFCQGKINLSKNEFVEMYEKGISLDEIAEIKNVTRDDLIFLRQLYNIKRKGSTFIHRKQTETSLTQRQKEIIYGSLMGDAKQTSPSSVGFGHGPKQKEYIFWKYKELESVASKNSLKEYKTFSNRYNKESISWRFYTHANTDIENIIKQFYGADGKQISREILENLTPLSLAVWYMDDGTASWSRKKREETGQNISPEFKFCTDSFTLESCYNIMDWLDDKFCIQSYLRKRGIRKDGEMSYRVKIARESNDYFVNLIKPYILPMFNYKICYDARML